MSSSDRQRRHARRLSRSGRNTIMLPIDFYFDFASPYGFRDDAYTQPKNVVWLTTRDDQQGMWRNPKEVRITLVIPSTDRRLVRCADWMRKHDPDLYRIAVSLGHTGWETFYCYFGIVPVSYLRAVEYADPERRAAWRGMARRLGTCKFAIP
jgi:hypothetical protein